MNSIKKNFAYNVVYQILAIILPFVTAPYVSRVLGVRGVGIYSYTYSVASYFLMFATLGMSNHGNRSIASTPKTPEDLGKTFVNNYVIQIVTGLVATIAYILFVTLWVRQNATVALIQTVMVVSGLFDINWFFFGIEKFKITVTRNTICKLLSVLAIFLFVKTTGDLWKYVFIMAVTMLISQLLLWKFLVKEISLCKPNWEAIKKNILPVLILFLPVLSYSLYRVLDKVMLGAFSSVEQVGYFENAEKILNIPIGITTALGTVMLPRVANLVSKGNSKLQAEYMQNSLLFVTIFSGAVCFGISAVSEYFVPIFYGSAFFLTGKILKYLIFTAVISGWANVLRMQYLIPLHRDRVYVISMFLAAILNCGLNIVLIPRYAAFGTVIASLFAELLVLVYQMIAVRSDLQWNKLIRQNLPYLLISTLMLIVINIVNSKFHYSNLIMLVVDILVGVIIFGSMTLGYSLLTKDRLYTLVIKRK